MNDETRRDDPPGHDAQRNLEQKALRNVRGLVDRIAVDDEARRKSQKWVVGGIVALVAVLAAVVMGVVGNRPSGGPEIVIAPPASKAPPR